MKKFLSSAERMACRRTGGTSLYEHGASDVVDLTDGRRREADERLDVGQPAAVEEDVVDETYRGQEEQGQGRRREAGRATPVRGRHPRGYAAPDDAKATRP